MLRVVNKKLEILLPEISFIASLRFPKYHLKISELNRAKSKFPAQLLPKV